MSTMAATPLYTEITSDYNESDPNSTAEYDDYGGGGMAIDSIFLDLTAAIIYSLTCIIGIIGNSLVIFVVFRYAKMKTVTNLYILNLAIADVLFLIGIPLMIVTMMVKTWVFGYHMCKIFFILTSVNWFTSMFTLTVMSADRYMAVCHPVTSMRYRTPMISKIVCVIVWGLSLLVMMPIMLYTKTAPRGENILACTISWPSGQPIPPDKAFIWYTFLLGFAIPTALISVFYFLVITRLRTVGPVKKSKERRRSHRKVTRLVLTVIAVYFFCWVPYWIFQVHLTFASPSFGVNDSWKIYVFQVITILSYANSSLNPILYAFFSDNFRKSFLKAFKCAGAAEANSALTVETSVFPRRANQNSNKSVAQDPPSDCDDMELTRLNSNSNNKEPVHTQVSCTKPKGCCNCTK
ncbi:somatostatin receptor type 2-like [Lineus longissimus]|uniref:somatostatin receptor type 2-like n=1 Tax=Lineus longissimus TaxID=88925 RepID=UPI00315DD36B